MKPSGRRTVVALAAAAVVAGLIYVIRPAPPPGEAPVSRHPPLKASDRVRARLDQLRAEYPNWSGRPGALRARSHVAATPPAGDVGHDPEAGTSLETAASGAAASESLLGVDTDDIPAMAKIALADKDPDRRSLAVTVLGGSDDPAAIPVLEQALSDTDEDVRMAALQALSDFTEEPPVEAIESALSDPTPDIRFEALTILAGIGGERARNAVEKALNDPDEDVRDLAEGIMDSEATYEDETPPDQGQPGGNSGTE